MSWRPSGIGRSAAELEPQDAERLRRHALVGDQEQQVAVGGAELAGAAARDRRLKNFAIGERIAGVLDDDPRDGLGAVAMDDLVERRRARRATSRARRR